MSVPPTSSAACVRTADPSASSLVGVVSRRLRTPEEGSRATRRLRVRDSEASSGRQGRAGAGADHSPEVGLVRATGSVSRRALLPLQDVRRVDEVARRLPLRLLGLRGRALVVT